ncbi:hypothetical protein SLA2020_483390 [Shorea laevis]
MSLNSSRSANSGPQQSNRSFNSNSSNSNSTNNKKRKSHQKTLGAAWGANSRSSSRSSFRSSPFSDFGSYMVEKNRKLQHQFDAEASGSSHSGSSSVKPIFHGVSIFVDGFTIPSSQELRSYMLKYGGRFVNYFSRHHVTHIICSNLPDSKVKNLRSFSSGLPVVKPMWILDSVAANRLLSWVPYQLDQLVSNQPKLSAFFAVKSISTSEDALTNPVHPRKHESEELSLFDEGKPMNKLKVTDEPDDHFSEKANAIVNEESISYEGGNSCEIKLAEQRHFEIREESGAKDALLFCPEPSAAVNSHCSNNQSTKGSPSSRVAGPSKQRHSTLGDPNFVENYFKNSRLHFIGTWRSRYRRRFPSSLNRFDCTNSRLNVSGDERKTAIIHVDMDCFFVSVVIRNHPDLLDKPVAVCHSDNPKGTAEISSANYPARGYGIKAGMFVRNAKALCPHLVIFPYNFEAYEEVADQFYTILHKHCSKVQAVSCDEAFLDITDLEGQDPELLASAIRKEIVEATGCTASVGIAENMLLARLATRTAKPDGQCYIPPGKVDDYLDQLPIKALPGIGYVLEEKLKRRNVSTCGQLRTISKDSLQKDFGAKTGEMLWNYSRGIDNRLVGVIQESKSIGAEVNWGVRFRDLQDTQRFLLDLCKEVSLRLQGCGVQGRTFTLKIKKRRKDAGEPAKYMGCGDCENLSHTITVPVATDDVEVLQRITKQLFGSFHLDVKDIRGVGLQVSKLESVETSKLGLERRSLKSWLISASASREGQCHPKSVAKGRVSTDCEGLGGNSGQLRTDAVATSVHRSSDQFSGEGCSNQMSGLPPLCNLDIGVIESLPPELLSELNEIYCGKLVDLIAGGKGESTSFTSALQETAKGATAEANPPPSSDPVRMPMEVKEKQHVAEERQAALISGAESNNVAVSTLGHKKADLMPSSLSQVDRSVLEQLPEELRVDIVELLPAHRRQDFSSNAAIGTVTVTKNEPSSPKIAKNLLRADGNLWIGTPPPWVNQFKASSFLMLNILADMYYKSRSTKTLSSILQCTIAESLHSLDTRCEGWSDAIDSFCELLKQYIKLKLEVDIEEIYVCFRLLRRLTMKSDFFLEVYDIVFPYLQASVNENYGGSLHLLQNE